MVRKSQYRHLLESLVLVGLTLSKIWPPFKNLTITAKECMDMIAGLQVSSIVI